MQSLCADLPGTYGSNIYYTYIPLTRSWWLATLLVLPGHLNCNKAALWQRPPRTPSGSPSTGAGGLLAHRPSWGHQPQEVETAPWYTRGTVGGTRHYRRSPGTHDRLSGVPGTTGRPGTYVPSEVSTKRGGGSPLADQRQTSPPAGGGQAMQGRMYLVEGAELEGCEVWTGRRVEVRA